MRSHLLVASVVVIGSSLAWSQPPEGRGGRGRMMMGPPGGMSNVALVGDEEVLKELGVNDEQKGYLAEFRKAAEEEDAKFRASLEDVDRAERFEKFREYREKRTPEIDASLKEILGDEKLKRLNQIQLQAGGVMSLMSPPVAKDVGLTEDQQNQMRDLARESFMQLRQRGEGDGGDRAEAFAKARKEFEAKALGVLTDKQKERWTAMLGEPAKVDFDRLRRSMRPERGRPGRDRDRDRPNRSDSAT